MGDHPLAALHAEIDVEIRHGHPLRIQQALEEEVVAQRVQIRDAEAVGHQRCGAGAPAAHRHGVLPRPVDELLHDQKVAGETHLDDHAQLVIQPFAVALRRYALGSAVVGQVAIEGRCGALLQHVRQRLALRHRIRRQVVGAQLHRVAAALGEFDAVVQRLRQVREQFAHFRRRAQILLIGVRAFAARIVQHAALLDAHAGFVRLEILRGQEAHVVAGHQRDARCRRQIRGGQDELRLARPAGAHDFQVHPVPERPPPRGQHRRRGVAGQRTAHVAALPQQHNQAVRRGEHGLPLNPPMAASATTGDVRIGGGDKPQQIAIAALRGHQQATAVGAVVVLVVQIHADDGFHAGLPTGAVELDETEQIAVIRERHGRHAELGRPGNQIPYVGKAVVDGVLAVDGEMDELPLGIRGDDLVASLIGHRGCVLGLGGGPRLLRARLLVGDRLGQLLDFAHRLSPTPAKQPS